MGQWLGLVATAIIAAVAGMFGAAARSVKKYVDRVDDRAEERRTSLAREIDIRLRSLEEDVRLVKQHLLGNSRPASA